jgi:hypothetical protein
MTLVAAVDLLLGLLAAALAFAWLWVSRSLARR